MASTIKIDTVTTPDGTGDITFNRPINAAQGGVGKVKQVVYTHVGTSASSTSANIPWDSSTPQNTEGFEAMSKSITPSSTSNLLRIDCMVTGGQSARGSVIVALFQDSTADALAVVRAKASNANADMMDSIHLTHMMVAGTTSSTTFKVRIGEDAAGTVYFNRYSTDSNFGGKCDSGIIITEYEV